MGALFAKLLTPLNSLPGSLRPGSTDSCINVNAPNAVSYSVRLTASPEACQDPDQVVSARIQFVGFGQVELSISLQCDCGCEASAVSTRHVTLSGAIYIEQFVM